MHMSPSGSCYLSVGQVRVSNRQSFRHDNQRLTGGFEPVVLTFKSRCTMPFTWQWLTLSRICCMQWLPGRRDTAKKPKEREQLSTHRKQMTNKQTVQTKSNTSGAKARTWIELRQIPFWTSVFVLFSSTNILNETFEPCLILVIQN